MRLLNLKYEVPTSVSHTNSIGDGETLMQSIIFRHKWTTLRLNMAFLWVLRAILLSVATATGATSCSTARYAQAERSLIAKTGPVTVHKWTSSVPVRGYRWIDNGEEYEELSQSRSMNLEVVQLSEDCRIRYFLRIGDEQFEIVFPLGVRATASRDEQSTYYADIQRQIDPRRIEWFIQVEHVRDGRLIRKAEMRLIL